MTISEEAADLHFDHFCIDDEQVENLNQSIAFLGDVLTGMNYVVGFEFIKLKNSYAGISSALSQKPDLTGDCTIVAGPALLPFRDWLVGGGTHISNPGDHHEVDFFDSARADQVVTSVRQQLVSILGLTTIRCFENKVAPPPHLEWVSDATTLFSPEGKDWSLLFLRHWSD